MIVLLAAGACNKHTGNKRFVFVHYEELKPVNYIFKVLTGIYIIGKLQDQHDILGET